MLKIQIWMRGTMEYSRDTIPGPTEDQTQEMFEEMYQFVESQRFDRLGIFQYSHEDDTHAFGMEDNVEPEVKQERMDIIMDLQQGISAELNQQKIGKTFKVLFDRHESGFFIGRTEFDSPEVDNEVLVPADQYVRLGDFANVKIKSATEFDLYGDLV